MFSPLKCVTTEVLIGSNCDRSGSDLEPGVLLREASSLFLHYQKTQAQNQQ